MTRVALVAALLLGCGGGADRPAPFPVVFVARADGVPLAGVRVVLDTDLAGTTGADGILGVLVHGQEGESLRLRATCLEGY
ncbi:MAG: hypothetical protein IT378_21750 [Sandaracinaceae bacterium]|nr:hypothetical protein [Sandaracinaceae bacterium]